MDLNVIVRDGAVAIGHDYFLIILVLAIGFDYFTGVLKSIIWRVTDSSLSLKGLVKHSCVVAFIFLVSLASKVYSIPVIEPVVLGMFLISYGISITENLSVMFDKEPAFLKTKIRKELKKYKDMKEVE